MKTKIITEMVRKTSWGAIIKNDNKNDNAKDEKVKKM
jgi:hypothetical protein